MILHFKGKPESDSYQILVSIELEVAEKLIKKYKDEWHGTNDFDGFLGMLEYCVQAAVYKASEGPDLNEWLISLNPCQTEESEF